MRIVYMLTSLGMVERSVRHWRRLNEWQSAGTL